MGRNNISAGNVDLDTVYFYIFKIFLKKFKIFLFFYLLQINNFLIFSDVLILKIIFNIIFILLAFLLPRDALLFDVIYIYIQVKISFIKVNCILIYITIY
jgi:hypothetical protein